MHYLYVQMCIYVLAWLPFEELDGFYSYAAVMNFTIIGRCPMNNILGPKGDPSRGPPTHRIVIFSKRFPTNLIEYQ